MIRQVLVGTIYSVTVTIKRQLKSCAGLEDFSTFNSGTDSYSWQSFKDFLYIVIPSGRKENIIRVTMYLQCGKEEHASLLQRAARNILENEFFPNVCGVTVVRVGKPRLFLRPHQFDHDIHDEAENCPEGKMDMITHS